MQRRLPRRGEVPSRLSGPGLGGVETARGQTYEHQATYPRGSRAVRLEFFTMADEVLCSDFEAWHFALNYWYLPKDPAMAAGVEAQLRRGASTSIEQSRLRDRWAHDAIERSWDRIFTIRRNATSVQACLWKCLYPRSPTSHSLYRAVAGRHF
jgi:hypothetical protein